MGAAILKEGAALRALQVVVRPTAISGKLDHGWPHRSRAVDVWSLRMRIWHCVPNFAGLWPCRNTNVKYSMSEWTWRQKAIGGIYFRKKANSWDSTSDTFKPQLKSGIFKYICWLNGSFFGANVRGFLKEWVKTYLKAPISSLNSPNFSVYKSIFSLWLNVDLFLSIN
jgi:hypothetical protein